MIQPENRCPNGVDCEWCRERSHYGFVLFMFAYVATLCVIIGIVFALHHP